MKVYFMLSRNSFVAVLCAVVLIFMLCVTFKTALIPKVKDGATNESRVNYILSLGYTVYETPVASKQTVIPESYGKVYEDYVALQTASGFPLGDFRGCSAWIYEYKDDLDNKITLIVAEDEVIGGHIIVDGSGEPKPLQIKGKQNGNNKN